MTVDFDQYNYYPCLQCSEVEQLGYRELSASEKNAIIPILELSQVKNEASFAETLEVPASLFGSRPFILDLSKDRAPSAYVPKNNPDHAKIRKLQEAQNRYNGELQSLLNSFDGFRSWRECVKAFPNAIPVLQFTDPTSQVKSIFRQAALLSKAGFEKMAIRINSETSDDIFPIIGQIISILDSADQLLLIVDCGQVRQKIADKAEFAKKAVARVLEELEPAQILSLCAVCLHDSFTTPPDNSRFYESYSRELWREARTAFPFLFADYAGHKRRKNPTTYMPSEWKAQVTYPLPEGWIIYKHPNAQDATGWETGAKAVMGEANFDDALNCWGSNLIKSAIAGNAGQYSSARYWHASKVNMHIHRQIIYSNQIDYLEEDF